MKLILARILIVLGFLCVAYASYLLYLRYAPNRLSFTKAPLPNNTAGNIAYTPIFIHIDSIQKNLPVIPAVIEDNTWETTDKGVSYLLSSSPPGKGGNSIFYGHNYENLLGPLIRVKKGDRIEVELSSGKKRIYKVSYTQSVDPNATYILEQTDDERITIYTCTGFLDSKRFVVVGIPEVS